MASAAAKLNYKLRHAKLESVLCSVLKSVFQVRLNYTCLSDDINDKKTLTKTEAQFIHRYIEKNSTKLDE